MLGQAQLAASLAAGLLVCAPAPTAITAAHLDLHLGRYYWKPRSSASIARVLNGFHVAGEASSKKVTPVVDVATADPIKCYTLYDSHDTPITIGPRAMILGHTLEAVGATVRSLHPQLRPNPMIIAWGLVLHSGVQQHGIWTLALYNRNDWALTIPPHARIAMMEFLAVDDESQERIVWDATLWSPETMLDHMHTW